MESINTIKEVATKAIWGDNNNANQEPISGVNGDVSKGEPYDAGNMGEPSEMTKDTAPDETGTAPVETDLSSPRKESPPSNPTTTTDTAPDETDLHQPKSTDLKSPETKSPEHQPHKTAPSSHLPGDSTKAQNDVRSPSDPDAQHHNAHPKNNVDDTGAGLDVGDNPEKLDGPGPRPLEVIAKEHGGDAGNSSGSVDKHEEEAPEQGIENSGTGELYMKSSGLKADGGDFDAAKPGAGREADRLLEEKGIHTSSSHGHGANGKMNGNGEAAAANGGVNGHGGKEKVSLKNKIKAKLHRNSATAST
ncbi:hypothetical protein QBC34DRAFT_109556 [Podospora aff. communis PSN243]|uniref:Glycine-rich cell wall structural protein 1 n=1 Tax=Podospora aff. communis PSN243 TaxID=3040156 RepID=A0AAV9GJI6_9PEZI|nr:hypothetical protein QBC34DRAFT_109556 [Podospora aff. communis PSN243]